MRYRRFSLSMGKPRRTRSLGFRARSRFTSRYSSPAASPNHESIEGEKVRISRREQAALELACLPELSICIVNYNCCDYLRRLLQSIEACSEELRTEIFVVDNASTDGSALMVGAEFPQVRLLRCARHQGVAAAYNKAARRAQGKFLLFLNNDTIIIPGALTTMVRFFERHPELSAVGPSITFPDGKQQGCVRKGLRFRALVHRISFIRWTRLFRSANREYQQVTFDLKQSGSVEHLVGPALLVRRQQFMSIGGWDEQFELHMEDVDLALRLRRFGKMYYLADAQLIHCGGIATQLDVTYAYRCTQCSLIHFIRKYHGARAARIYKVLTTADMPLRVIVLALTWIVKRLFGNPERAARNYRKLLAATHFLLFGMPRYWRC
jgi:GT2 family glycosyltransferase